MTKRARICTARGRPVPSGIFSEDGLLSLNTTSRSHPHPDHIIDPLCYRVVHLDHKAVCALLDAVGGRKGRAVACRAPRASTGLDDVLDERHAVVRQYAPIPGL